MSEYATELRWGQFHHFSICHWFTWGFWNLAFHSLCISLYKPASGKLVELAQEHFKWILIITKESDLFIKEDPAQTPLETIIGQQLPVAGGLEYISNRALIILIQHMILIKIK